MATRDTTGVEPAAICLTPLVATSSMIGKTTDG